MKKLLITLMLISPFSFADWDDVYYCQMTSFVGATLEGKKLRHELEKFQFKLDRAKSAMVFGGSGYFRDSVMVVDVGRVWPEQESWYASDEYSILYFEEGKFLYVAVGSKGTTSTFADCDKF